MAFVELTCKKCGGELHSNGEHFECKYCHTTYLNDQVERESKALKAVLDEAKQEKLANNRRLLWEEIHAEYINSARIVELCRTIRGIKDDDFEARFFEIANSKNVKKINKFLDDLDVNKAEQAFWVDEIAAFLIKSLGTLGTGVVLPLNDLVERAYKGKNENLQKYNEYATQVSIEANKVDSGIYEVGLPRDVFVMYSSKDMPKVKSLVETLEENGITCFVAMRNLQHGMGAVENYERQLQIAMDNCKTVVFLSSKNSRRFDCDAVKVEIPYLKQRDIKMAPHKFRQDYEKMPKLYKKPRVEYRLDLEKTGGSPIVAEFFGGLEYAYNEEEVLRRIENYLIGGWAADEKRAQEEIDRQQREMQEQARLAEEHRKAEAAQQKAAEEKRLKDQAAQAELFQEQIEALKEQIKNQAAPVTVGGKVSETKYCLNCGTENLKGAKVCMECGKSLFVETKEEYDRIKYEAEEKARLERERKEEERRKLQLEKERLEIERLKAEEFKYKQRKEDFTKLLKLGADLVIVESAQKKIEEKADNFKKLKDNILAYSVEYPEKYAYTGYMRAAEKKYQPLEEKNREICRLNEKRLSELQEKACDKADRRMSSTRFILLAFMVILSLVGIVGVVFLEKLLLGQGTWGVLFGKKSFENPSEELFCFSVFVACVTLAITEFFMFDDYDWIGLRIFFCVILLGIGVYALIRFYLIDCGGSVRWWEWLLLPVMIILMIIAILPHLVVVGGILFGVLCLLIFLTLWAFEGIDEKYSWGCDREKIRESIGNNFKGKLELIDYRAEQSEDYAEAREKDAAKTSEIIRKRSDIYDAGKNKYKSVAEQYRAAFILSDKALSSLRALQRAAQERVERFGLLKDDEKNFAFVLKIFDLLVYKKEETLQEALSRLHISSDYKTTVKTFEQVLERYKAEYKNDSQSGLSKEALSLVEGRLKSYNDALVELDGYKDTVLETTKKLNGEIEKIVTSTQKQMKEAEFSLGTLQTVRSK